MTEKLVSILEKEGVYDVSLFNSKKRLGDVMRNYSDTSKAKSKLGWEPKIKLADGLCRTIKYFKEKLDKR